MNKKTSSSVKILPAILFWMAAWHILALRMDNVLLLPTPVMVLRRLGELALTAQFWQITLFSIGRILVGAVIAMGLGIVLAVLTCTVPLADSLIAPVMTAVQATPVASFTILVLICGMMVLPVVWNNVCAGIRLTDRALLEMAKVYRLSPMLVLKRIYVPSVMPYFRAACMSALGLGWKAGIAAEVLTVPKNSMGKMIAESKLYMMTEDLFAWTLAVGTLSLLIQTVVLRLLKGREKGC